MIRLENLCAGYGSRQVLFDVCTDIERGQLVSVIGPNACGKSTMLKAIEGILPLWSGEVFADGVAISNMRRGDIAKRISYLAQGRSTPDMTVGQMVLHGRFPHLSYPRVYSEKDRRIAREAMEKVGVDNVEGSAMSDLSGGMRQNAYIAMALAQDTEYILLDEPTTYLDIAHQLDLMRMLRTLAQSGKGIVAVMHDIPLALGYSDRIIVLESGRIAANGTPDEVWSSGILERIFGVQILRAPDGKGFYYGCR